MTTYQKELENLIARNYCTLSPQEVTRKLVKMGLIDNTMMKILVIREFVHALVKNGESKLNAMWSATEQFACSYEYVRKCLYYYKDVNIPSERSENV